MNNLRRQSCTESSISLSYASFDRRDGGGGGWVMAYSILVSAPVTLWVNLGFELDLTGLGLGLGELGTRGTRVWN